MNDLILYITEGGRSPIKLRAQEQAAWLAQLEMAELFDATRQNVSLHLKSLFKDEEVGRAATVKKFLTVQTEGRACNDFPLLTHARTISHEQMETRTGALYHQFYQDRKRLDAIEADRQDEADLQALETKLKRRQEP